LVRLKKCGQFLFVQQLGQLGDIDSNPPRLVFGEQLAAVSTGNRMDQIVLYKGFRIRAYQEWSGLWLAETNKPVRRRPGASDHDDTDTEYIATPSGHPTPEATIAFIKQMIDSPSTTR
jgi:hypothetical protein